MWTVKTSEVLSLSTLPVPDPLLSLVPSAQRAKKLLVASVLRGQEYELVSNVTYSSFVNHCDCISCCEQFSL